MSTLRPAGSSPDPHLLHAIELLRQPGLSVRTAAGYSDRELHRLFVRQVGLAPKTFQRVARFQRFRALTAGPAAGLTLAQAAATCGHADQAHLAHECRDLADRTPTALAVLAAISRQRGPATGSPD